MALHIIIADHEYLHLKFLITNNVSKVNCFTHLCQLTKDLTKLLLDYVNKMVLILNCMTNLSINSRNKKKLSLYHNVYLKSVSLKARPEFSQLIKVFIKFIF